MSDEGNLIWRILFGVIMASLLLGIFLAYTNSQREYNVNKKAQNLANNLARTAFSALEDKQSFYELPKTIGKSNYEIKLENNTFVVVIIRNRKNKQEYSSSVGFNLKKISLPEPNGTLYTKENAGSIIISSEPINFNKNLVEDENLDTPNFYHFAKRKPREATGIISAYNYGKKKYDNKTDLDIQAYEWKSENVLETSLTTNDKLIATIEVYGYENNEDIGKVENTWKVNKCINREEKLSLLAHSCPSIKKANFSDWIFTSPEVTTQFLRKSWIEAKNNEFLKIENLQTKAVTVTTNISSYPAWQLKFKSTGTLYTVYLSAMPWKADENQPGFLFESEPSLEAKT